MSRARREVLDTSEIFRSDEATAPKVSVKLLGHSSERHNARAFMETVTDLARMPGADVVVKQGSFEDAVPDAPQADLTIFGLTPEPDFVFMRTTGDQTRSRCLFVADSRQEIALA